jgi:peptidoglycan hydrolase-like protein with peptidoglycan-binding domain
VFKSTFMRRWLIPAVTGVAALGIGITVVPAEARIRSTCDGISPFRNVANGANEIRFLPSVGRPAGPSPECLLGRGSVGEQVRYLQNMMRFVHYMNIVADGRYGLATKRTMSDLQRRLQVDDDGIYGPTTQPAMGFPTWNGTEYDMVTRSPHRQGVLGMYDGRALRKFLVTLNPDGVPFIAKEM